MREAANRGGPYQLSSFLLNFLMISRRSLAYCSTTSRAWSVRDGLRSWPVCFSSGGYFMPSSMSKERGQTNSFSGSRRSPRRQMGVCEYLGLADVTPHDLRRTAACILEQLGFSDAIIGAVMTHKATGKDASPVTRAHYLVPVPIIARPVDPRIKALDDLDQAIREILN